MMYENSSIQENLQKKLEENNKLMQSLSDKESSM